MKNDNVVTLVSTDEFQDDELTEAFNEEVRNKSDKENIFLCFYQLKAGGIYPGGSFLHRWNKYTESYNLKIKPGTKGKVTLELKEKGENEPLLLSISTERESSKYDLQMKEGGGPMS